MPDQAALDSTISMLRSTHWSDVNQLAIALAVSLSGVSRQPTFNRGLHDNVVADASGGTKIAVGDTSIARPSVSLQTPQRGFLIKQGAVSTRRQARLETEVKTVPAKVLAVDGATITVALVGDKPQTGIDPITGQSTSGGAGTDLSNSQATVMTILTTGNQFANPADPMSAGPLPPNVGQTVSVTVSTQYEKTTVWHNRARRNFPRVTETKGATTATAVNGFCCQDVNGSGGDPGGT